MTAGLPDVPAYRSRVEDLALHGPRILGFATPATVAARFGIDADDVEDLLLGFAGRGWVSHSSFAGSRGWSLTDAGRVENERRLAEELDRAGAREAVAEAHAQFLPLNRRFGTACTNWQIRPTRSDPMAFNDHSDWGWDERVMRSLEALERSLSEVTAPLAAALQRLDGYHARYSAALAKVNAGRRRWVDAPEVDSCHTVWIQLHEDLLATLGIPRGSDG